MTLDRVDRELGGCPVMHRDFTEPAAAGTYWALADELRERGHAHFDTVAQGFWVFTRHDAVREIYGQPGLFSSESFTPWEPDPRRTTSRSTWRRFPRRATSTSWSEPTGFTRRCGMRLPGTACALLR